MCRPASTTVAPLSGSGLEYLVDEQGEIRAVFLDGKMIGTESDDRAIKASVDSSEVTINL